MIHHLTIICFIIILVKVLSQGASGSGKGGGGGGGIGSFLVASTIFGIGVLCLGIMKCIEYFKNDCKRRLAPKENSEHLNEASANDNVIIPMSINSIFESGRWASRYYQYKNWHGPFLHEIIFNIGQNTLNGNGTDDIGQFILIGDISTKFLTINMTKKYLLNTGDEKENLGHEVKINLKWDNTNHVFLGKWFIHTYKFKGEDLYELVKVQ